MIRHGAVLGLDESLYHRGPELSSTGAKTLLSCPARYAWQRTHGQASKPEFDFGTAAHRFILGAGATIERVSASSWATNAAKDAAKTARAEGRTPLLVKDYLRALDVAKAVKRHPVAGPLVNGDGISEVSLFWTDEESGVKCRARLDRFTQLRSGRDVVIDVKTTTAGGAAPGAFARTAHNFGYHLQAAFYLAGAVATGFVEPDAAFLFVVVEKEPPHPVAIYELDHDALTLGNVLARKAIDTFRECSLTGVWPSYSLDIEPLSLPAYAWKDSTGAPF